MKLEKDMLTTVQAVLNDTVEMLEKSGLASISLKIGKCGELEDIEIEVKKPDVVTSVVAAPTAVVAERAAAVVETEKKISGYEVTAPLIGVAYSAASPGAEPFVKVGQKVKKGDTLCIIDAMKVMNEVPSDRDGTVAAVMFNNGSVVQFGDVLVVIE
jgi:Biotin carboxyl carrier protein